MRNEIDATEAVNMALSVVVKILLMILLISVLVCFFAGPERWGYASARVVKGYTEQMNSDKLL